AARAVGPGGQLAAAGALHESLEFRADELILLRSRVQVRAEPETDTLAQLLSNPSQTLAWELTAQRFAKPELAYPQRLIHQLTPFSPRLPRTAAPAVQRLRGWSRRTCSRRPSPRTARQMWLHRVAGTCGPWLLHRP